MRTIRIAAFVAISLMSTSFTLAEESRLAFVFATENREEAETRLVTLRDGVEIKKESQGNVGLFTSTNSRLFVLAQNEDGYILRCRDLRDGRELPMPKLQSLAVDPIVRMNGFTGTMCVDVWSSTLLYGVARSDMVEEETGESDKTKNDVNKPQDGKVKKKRKVHKRN